MARLWSDGAEMGDLEFWDYVNPYNMISAVQVPIPIGGEWCYKGAYLGAWKLTGTPLAEFYLRYRLRVHNIDQASAARMLGWRCDTEELGFFSIDALKRFCVYRGAGINPVEVANAGITIAEDTWYLIEIHVLLDDLAGRYEVFIDGVQYIDYTGDTIPAACGTADNIYWSGNGYCTIYLDDLALNDTTGLSDNTWCGDGIVVKMYPDGNGAHNNWTNSVGTSVNNFLYVDDFPNDGDLTYVYQDGSSAGVQDQYTLNDLDYTNKTVLRIWPEARVRKSSPDGSTLKLGILPSGGVDTMSAAKSLVVDHYDRVIGDEYKTNPVDSLPWEELDLDSLQVIAEIG